MKQVLIQVFAVLAFSVCWAMDFKPPEPDERLRAIGDTEGLPEALRVALDPTTDFAPIPVPKPGDWLAEHEESGQTYMDFLKSARSVPDEDRRKIYLQPLGEFEEDRTSSLEALSDYAAAYFEMDVEVLPVLELRDHRITTRVNPLTRNRQILTTDVMALLNRKVPIDAFCVLAITMQDLYPHPTWNFVFGQASLQERVGVFSFARYDPAFYGEERRQGYRKILLRRSCRVLAHELAHMFSLAHCIYFRCVLNGSNHLQESDSRPLHLCPVCLRKLQDSIGFDVIRRYGNLLDFYERVGFEEEAGWVANRVRRISNH
jgi:archaemetzincin